MFEETITVPKINNIPVRLSGITIASGAGPCPIDKLELLKLSLARKLNVKNF